MVDKDLAAAVLARDLGAELLLILTDVDAVYAGLGHAGAAAAPAAQSVAEAEQLDRAGAFGEGSMAPKVRAAVDFVRRTSGRAIITELSRGRAAVRGEARNDHHNGERREHPRVPGQGDSARNQGVPIPPGEVATTPEQAEAIARRSSGPPWWSRRRCTPAAAARRAA